MGPNSELSFSSMMTLEATYETGAHTSDLLHS